MFADYLGAALLSTATPVASRVRKAAGLAVISVSARQPGCIHRSTAPGLMSCISAPAFNSDFCVAFLHRRDALVLSQGIPRWADAPQIRYGVGISMRCAAC